MRSRERLEYHLAYCVGLLSTKENGEQLAGGSPKVGLNLVAYDTHDIQQQQQPFILTRLFFPVYWGQPHLWPSHNILLHLDLSQASSLQSPFSLISSLNTFLHLFLGLPFTPLPSTCSVSILFIQHNSSPSQHGQTTSACFVISLQQCHQLPACSSLTHCFSFHLNSLLSSISTSSFHSLCIFPYILYLCWPCLTAIQHCT